MSGWNVFSVAAIAAKMPTLVAKLPEIVHALVALTGALASVLVALVPVVPETWKPGVEAAIGALTAAAVWLAGKKVANALALAAEVTAILVPPSTSPTVVVAAPAPVAVTPPVMAVAPAVAVAAPGFSVGGCAATGGRAPQAPAAPVAPAPVVVAAPQVSPAVVEAHSPYHPYHIVDGTPT